MLDLKTLHHISQNGLQNFAKGRILDGIAALRTLLPYCSGEAILCAEADSMEENYHHMLSFLKKGGNDEKRSEVQAGIQRKGIALTEQASRAIRLTIGTDLYSKALALLQEHYEGPEDLQARVIQAYESSPLTEETEGDRQDDLFDLLWTAPLWTAQDTARWYDFILTQRDMVQQHFIGAVFLSAWEHYDAEKVQLLNLFADSECHRTRITAVAYLLMLRLCHTHLVPLMPPLPDSLLSRKGRTLIDQVQYEMLLMLISEQNMKQEVEEAEALAKNIITGKKPLNLDGIKAIVELKGRYLRKRLQRGLDPNLAKAPLLHSCKYMQRISHWFLPFDKNHPLFQSVMIDDKGNERHKLSGLLDLVLDCDVDKMATLYLVANDKDFSKAMLQVGERDIPNIENAIIPEYTFRFIMQDLFRFFTHSPLHTQLASPFRQKQTWLDFPDLVPLFSHDNTLLCCSMLSELGMGEKALAYLDSLIQREGASAPALLLKGQLLMQEQHYAEAASCLRNAEILQPSDADILRLLAECYAAQHRFEEELEYLQQLAELSPDDTTYRRLIPATMVKAGKHEEALQLLFKLDYEQEEDDPAIASLIADTALAIGKLDIAERYTEKGLENRDKGLESEHLRMGHIRMLQGDWKGGIDHYEQFVNAYCRETGKDIQAALAILDSQWHNSQWPNVKAPDFLLIHDILLAQVP